MQYGRYQLVDDMYIVTNSNGRVACFDRGRLMHWHRFYSRTVPTVR